MFLNIGLSVFWTWWWGTAFTTPEHVATQSPLDWLNLGLYALIGVATPILSCAYYRTREPHHAPWPRPSLAKRLRTMVRGPHPGWVFVLAWACLLAGAGCVGVAHYREVPVSGFHALYLVTGAAMMLGSFIALRVFAVEFEPR